MAGKTFEDLFRGWSDRRTAFDRRQVELRKLPDPKPGTGYAAYLASVARRSRERDVAFDAGSLFLGLHDDLSRKLGAALFLVAVVAIDPQDEGVVVLGNATGFGDCTPRAFNAYIARHSGAQLTGSVLIETFARAELAIAIYEKLEDFRVGCWLTAEEETRRAQVSSAWMDAMRSGGGKLVPLLRRVREDAWVDGPAVPEIGEEHPREALRRLLHWVVRAIDLDADRHVLAGEREALDLLFDGSAVHGLPKPAQRIDVDEESRTISIGNEKMRLSESEFTAGKMLCNAPGYRVSREMLARALRLGDFKRSRVFRSKGGERFRAFVKQKDGEVWLEISAG